MCLLKEAHPLFISFFFYFFLYSFFTSLCTAMFFFSLPKQREEHI